VLDGASYVPDGPVNSWVLLQREGEARDDLQREGGTRDDVRGEAGSSEGYMDVDERGPAGADEIEDLD